MVSEIILIVCIVLTAILYMGIIMLYIVNRKNNTSATASEEVLKILDDEASINLIESKESIFSKYNIKRKMVKLSSNTYDSNNSFKVAIASLLAGYSLTDNKLLNYIAYIFKELKFISFTSIISLLASIFVSNAGDAKISIILLIIIAVYLYILDVINNDAISKIKIEDNNVNKILNKFMIFSKVSFIITLIEIIRLVVIILGI